MIPIAAEYYLETMDRLEPSEALSRLREILDSGEVTFTTGFRAQYPAEFGHNPRAFLKEVAERGTIRDPSDRNYSDSNRPAYKLEAVIVRNGVRLWIKIWFYFLYPDNAVMFEFKPEVL